jgi:hypothetical protein
MSEATRVEPHTPSPCDAALDYVYGELTGEALTAFEAHMTSCARCQAEVASFGRVRSVVRAALPALDVPTASQPMGSLHTQLLAAAAQRKPPAKVLSFPSRFRKFVTQPVFAMAATFLLVAGTVTTLWKKGALTTAKQESAAPSTPAVAATPKETPAPIVALPEATTVQPELAKNQPAKAVAEPPVLATEKQHEGPQKHYKADKDDSLAALQPKLEGGRAMAPPKPAKPALARKGAVVGGDNLADMVLEGNGTSSSTASPSTGEQRYRARLEPAKEESGGKDRTVDKWQARTDAPTTVVKPPPAAPAPPPTVAEAEKAEKKKAEAPGYAGGMLNRDGVQSQSRGAKSSEPMPAQQQMASRPQGSSLGAGGGEAPAAPRHAAADQRGGVAAAPMAKPAAPQPDAANLDGKAAKREETAAAADRNVADLRKKAMDLAHQGRCNEADELFKKLEHQYPMYRRNMTETMAVTHCRTQTGQFDAAQYEIDNLKTTKTQNNEVITREQDYLNNERARRVPAMPQSATPPSAPTATPAPAPMESPSHNMSPPAPMRAGKKAKKAAPAAASDAYSN